MHTLQTEYVRDFLANGVRHIHWIASEPRALTQLFNIVANAIPNSTQTCIAYP